MTYQQFFESQTAKYFSNLKLEPPKIDLPKLLKEKKFVMLYSERTIGKKNDLQINRCIVKTPQGFNIDCNKNEDDFWEMTIYFKEEQETELQFFIKNFQKSFKDDTNNN